VGKAEYLVFGQNLHWLVTGYFSDTFKKVKEGVVSREVAQLWADEYFNNSELSTYLTAVSIVNLGSIPDLVGKFQEMVEQINTVGGVAGNCVGAARGAAQKLDSSRGIQQITDYDYHVDLYDFTQKLKGGCATVSSSLVEAANAVLGTQERVIVSNQTRTPANRTFRGFFIFIGIYHL